MSRVAILIIPSSFSVFLVQRVINSQYLIYINSQFFALSCSQTDKRTQIVSIA